MHHFLAFFVSVTKVAQLVTIHSTNYYLSKSIENIYYYLPKPLIIHSVREYMIIVGSHLYFRVTNDFNTNKYSLKVKNSNNMVAWSNHDNSIIIQSLILHRSYSIYNHTHCYTHHRKVIQIIK